jgi:excinuclease UvrABC nuclease subunit
MNYLAHTVQIWRDLFPTRALPHEAIRLLTDHEGVPGCYVLFRNHSVFYIGRSVNLRTRVFNSLRQRMDGKSASLPHEEWETWGISVLPAHNFECDYKELERILIDQFDPPANILGGWYKREPIPGVLLTETAVIAPREF